MRTVTCCSASKHPDLDYPCHILALLHHRASNTKKVSLVHNDMHILHTYYILYCFQACFLNQLNHLNHLHIMVLFWMNHFFNNSASWKYQWKVQNTLHLIFSNLKHMDELGLSLACNSTLEYKYSKYSVKVKKRLCLFPVSSSRFL